VFVARSGAGKRLCHNTEQVEQLFLDAGFVRVYPERFPVAVQAKMFAEAEVVAGYAGSGMINAVWSAGEAARIVLASRSYPAINEFQLGRHFGSQIYYFWCDPDVPVSPHGMTKRAFHSDFTFDVARDGPALTELLARL
jgi:capsular polysaccharide biosynthesis protein